MPSVFIPRVQPKPRPKAYDLYWKFASRRHAAFEQRLRGEDGPWSDDPILQRFKFCNVFRALDRVSQYLIRDVAYRDPELDTSADRAFQIMAFRVFSNIDTWNSITQLLGRAPRIVDLEDGSFERAIVDTKNQKGRLYTGAFILCANKAYGHDEKYRNHVALFKHMFLDDRFGDKCLEVRSLEELVRSLESFPLIGPFMAYQIAIDLNYSELLDFDENDFTQPGPGAIRGIRKAFLSLGEYSPADSIRWMVDRQIEEIARIGLLPVTLFGRALHSIDCQGLFCELDKYCRAALPELTSNRTRIKSRFTPKGDLPAIFLPPKWRAEVPAETSDRLSATPRHAQQELKFA